MKETPMPDEDQKRIKKKESELQSLTNKNERKYKHISAHGVRLDPSAMMANRLELMVEYFMGKGEARLDFEILWQGELESLLAQAEKEATRANLTHRRKGGNGGGLIIP